MPVKSNTWKSRLFVDYMVDGSSFYVPTTVFTDASGQEIDRVSGYMGPAEFAEMVDSVLADYTG